MDHLCVGHGARPAATACWICANRAGTTRAIVRGADTNMVRITVRATVGTIGKKQAAKVRCDHGEGDCIGAQEAGGDKRCNSQMIAPLNDA